MHVFSMIPPASGRDDGIFPPPTAHLRDGLDVDVGIGERAHHRRGAALAVHHALRIATHKCGSSACPAH